MRESAASEVGGAGSVGVRRRLRHIGAAAALALLGAFGCGDGAAKRAAAAPVGIEPGQRAPELRGRLPGGGEFDLASISGSPTIVEFYRGSFCGLCRMQLASLELNLPHYRRRGVEVLAATGESLATGVGEMEELQLSFPSVTVDSSTLQRWGVVDERGSGGGTATFVLDRHGIIRFRHLGRNAADRVSDAALLTVVEQMANE